MSTVTIPFKQVVKPEPQKSGKIEIQGTLDGNLKIYMIEGEYEVWFNSQKDLGPTNKEAAKIRFDKLLDPSTCSKSEPVTPQPALTLIEGGVHPCPSCGRQVSNQRRVIGTELCTMCSPQTKFPLGVMDYSSKTGGVLMIVTDPHLFRILKKPVNQQR